MILRVALTWRVAKSMLLPVHPTVVYIDMCMNYTQERVGA